MWQMRMAEGLRRIMGGSDVHKAHEFQRHIDRLEETLLESSLEAFKMDMHKVQESPEKKLLLGSSRTRKGEAFKVWLPVERLFSGHSIVLGATGGGKSYFVLSLIVQLLTMNHATPLLVVDYKNELADLLVRRYLPAVLSTMSEERRAQFLERLVVVNPFSTKYITPLQILKRDPSISIELQAHDVCSVFEKTLGLELGPRQLIIMRYCLQIAIEQGLSFPMIKNIIENPYLLASLVRKCRLPDVRSYFCNRFPREPSQSVLSLSSRIDTMLLTPQVRLVLSGRENIDFNSLLRGKVVIINIGSPPYGCHDVAKFFGTLFFYKIAQAILSRPIDPSPPDAFIVMDEHQEGLTRELSLQMRRLLALARFKKMWFWLINQQMTPQLSPDLIKVINTNTNFKALFRCSFEDAQHFGQALPVTGRRLKPQKSFFDPSEKSSVYSLGEEKRLLEEEMAQLPDRWFYYYDKRKPYKAQLVRSQTLDIAKAIQLSNEAPQELLEAVERGSMGVPVAELEKVLRAREEEVKRIQMDVGVDNSIDSLQQKVEAVEEILETPAVIPFPIGKKRKTSKRKSPFPELG